MRMSKKHACQLCEATFFTSNNLEAHQLTHNMKEDVKIEPTDLLEISIKEEAHLKVISFKSEDS